MSNIYIQESWIDATRNLSCGDSDIYESFTDDKGQLFRDLQQTHGRCISKVYIDLKDGGAKEIGWVFQKKRKYEDTDEKYLLETWVSLHKEPPTETIEYHYL